MDRRKFVASAAAMAGAALGSGGQMLGATTKQEFYQLRKYTLQRGPQMQLTQDYFERALIPALNRMGMSPVGAFSLEVGPETPTYYLLIPATSVEALVTLDLRLPEDAEFLKAGAGFWTAPASAPAFLRVESSMMSAFAGWPKLVPPKKEKRMFQLRTYESAGYAAHARKVEMFNKAEMGIFTRTGLTPVFFGDTLVGPRLPNLTYMLTFADVAELTAKWAAFGADSAWKELSHRPEYSDAEIVSNISNLYLSPLGCSQI